jgi:DNA adenine methylase
MRSFISYIGGKSRRAAAIAARLAARRCYVEVFGGAGWVLFAREPAPVEVFNDADGHLVNLFRVVREEPAALARELSRMPRSRELYDALKRAPRPRNRVRAAAASYYLLKNAFSARVGFSASKLYAGKYAMLNDFAPWAARLNKVTVENLDFEDCLRRYDGPDTAFYLDPPYVGTERYYAATFDAAAHLRLRDCLANATGAWLLSYNDCVEVRRWYRGFRQEGAPAAYSAAKVGAAGRRPNAGRELLISNY